MMDLMSETNMIMYLKTDRQCSDIGYSSGFLTPSCFSESCGDTDVMCENTQCCTAADLFCECKERIQKQLDYAVFANKLCQFLL